MVVTVHVNTDFIRTGVSPWASETLGSGVAFESLWSFRADLTSLDVNLDMLLRFCALRDFFEQHRLLSLRCLHRKSKGTHLVRQRRRFQGHDGAARRKQQPGQNILEVRQGRATGQS